MISEEEKRLIEAGVKEVLETLFNGLHSEDDHGYDLYKFLCDNKDKIVKKTCDRIIAGRAALVD